MVEFKLSTAGSIVSKVNLPPCLSSPRYRPSSSFYCGPISREFPPNALCRKNDPLWRGGFSLGVDLGLSRTGVALSKGFSFRPLTVLELKGQKLELQLLEVAEQEEVDEFIIGLPISIDGKETSQSNKVRSVAGRFAARAAERGWRVYLQDEHGTSTDAVTCMVDINLGLPMSANRSLFIVMRVNGGAPPAFNILKGLRKLTRQGNVDAYAAMVVLERYFSTSGEEAELVLPKSLALQEKLRKGPKADVDFFPD